MTADLPRMATRLVPRASLAHLRICGAGLLLTVCLGMSTVSAQVLDIDGADLKAGEREVKTFSTVNGRYPSGTSGAPRSSHEFSAAYNPNDRVKLFAIFAADNPLDADWRADSIAFKTQLSLLKTSEAGGLGLGWATAIAGSVHRMSTNALLFGPIVQFTAGRTSLALNPFFGKTFGRNHEDGIALAYGWQLKHEIREGFSIGLEGFGTIDNLGHAPPTSEQDHRIGPVAFFEVPRGGGHTLTLDVGVFAGLTEATPDLSLKFNIGTLF